MIQKFLPTHVVAVQCCIQTALQFQLNSESWAKLVDQVKPDFAQILAHKFDEADLASSKRKLKLQSKNRNFAESCCELADASKVRHHFKSPRATFRYLF